MSGKLIVVTGFPATGTGKTTVVKKALSLLPNAVRIVTSTTRPAREGEVDGRDYNFISKRTFNAQLRAGDLLEYDQHYAHWYATPKSSVECALLHHPIALLTTDLRGAITLQKTCPDACFIAIIASAVDVVQFMNGRGDRPEKIAERLSAIAKEEQLFCKIAFDFTVVNAQGELPRTVQEFVRSITERTRIPKSAHT